MPGTQRIPYQGPPVLAPAPSHWPLCSVMSVERHSWRRWRRVHPLLKVCEVPPAAGAHYLMLSEPRGHRIVGKAGYFNLYPHFVCADVQRMSQWACAFSPFQISRPPMTHRCANVALLRRWHRRTCSVINRRYCRSACSMLTKMLHALLQCRSMLAWGVSLSDGGRRSRVADPGGSGAQIWPSVRVGGAERLYTWRKTSVAGAIHSVSDRSGTRKGVWDKTPTRLSPLSPYSDVYVLNAHYAILDQMACRCMDPLQCHIPCLHPIAHLPDEDGSAWQRFLQVGNMPWRCDLMEGTSACRIAPFC